MSAVRIILDCDTGTDDAIAILYALRRPGVRLEGVTTVFGNAGVEDTTRNTLQVLELAGRPDVPVARGAAHPLTGTFVPSPHPIHGRNGLGDVELPPPRTRPVGPDAASFLIDLVRRNPGEITLVPTGRMTNIALALEQAPEIARLVRQCVLMGGAARVPGNVTAVAEANIHGDPEAARILFRSGMNITMVGLDVTMQAIFTPEHLEAMTGRGGPVLEAVRQIIAFRLQAYMRREPHLGGCAIHDPLAVEVAVDPTIVRRELLPVDVECQGELTRGMTVADRRPFTRATPNVHVCLDVDAPRFLGRLVEHIAAHAAY